MLLEMNEIENYTVAILEVLIFVGGILIGYSYGKGYMSSKKKLDSKNE